MELERRGTRRKSGGNAEESSPGLTGAIIGCAMKVHSRLGPGLLEAAYEACLTYELSRAGLSYRRQVPIPLEYDNLRLDCGFRLDLLVQDSVVVELKSVDRLLPIHEAQLLTYLRVSRIGVGLIVNFNVTHLRHGLRRRVLRPR